MQSANPDVLIIGAGPTGLVLALWLARLGIRIRILDKTSEPGTTSRALAVQARTLEFYRQLGFADEVVTAGRTAQDANLWTQGHKRAHIVFGDMGAGISPYPFPFIYPQDEHERLLIAQLAKLNIHVERDTEFLSLEDHTTHITAETRSPNGNEIITAAYIAGCDGARSTVREQLRIGFPGGTYEHLFYVADVDATGPIMNGDLHIALDREEFLVVFPLAGSQRARFIGTVRDDSANADNLTWDDVSHRILSWIKADVTHVNWFSTYRVHHRVAASFRHGRAFLLGDAAHIHSPVGGQGMNTGIGDAVNLAWKLAAVIQQQSPAMLLETYEPERIAFAQRLVATTDRAFTAVTSSSPLARLVRLHIAPRVLPLLFRIRAARRFMYRTVSQTAIEYRKSAISEGHTGTLHAGDRLPWIRLGETDNFAPLQSLTWQIHVYGDLCPDTLRLSQQRNLPVHAFPWRAGMAPTGLHEKANYLIRPDGYIAFADPHAKAKTLAAYLDAHQLTFTT